MTTITEDYVSFEVAQLLKEKEFDEKCFALYNPDGILIQSGIRLNNTQVGRVKGSYSAPTLQMIMKWLREIHKLYIGINIEVGDIQTLPSYDFEETVLGYNFAIYNEETLIWAFKDKTPRSYEKACEAAIKYCLEQLI